MRIVSGQWLHFFVYASDVFVMVFPIIGVAGAGGAWTGTVRLLAFVGFELVICNCSKMARWTSRFALAISRLAVSMRFRSDRCTFTFSSSFSKYSKLADRIS